MRYGTDLTRWSQEHLLVQQTDFEVQMQSLLSKQEQEVKAKAESDMRIRLGVERSHRLF